MYMNDMTTTVEQLKAQVAKVIAEREWNQFHSPKNLSMAIAAEAAELMEKFLWLDSPASFDELATNRQEIEDELADVLIAVIAFANAANIEVSSALKHKLAITAAKYPIDKAK